MLQLYRSNQVERLASALTDVLSVPPADPFASELVVVHSAEMGRWLSLRLAQQLGICANVRFEFPGRAIDALLDAVDPRPEEGPGWSREDLLWEVLAALPRLSERPEAAPLRTYLGSSARVGTQSAPVSRRELQLASRLAWTLDRYLTYRPEMIQAWERGEHRGEWQATLWRDLRERIPGSHLAQRAERFLAAVADGLPVARLPQRISLFAISTLPPLYLDLFRGIARRIPVHLFLLCPSDAYWADLCSRRERSLLLTNLPGISAEELHLSTGNRLLAALGRLGRDFQQLLESSDAGYAEPMPDLFVRPGSGSMLHQVQADILELHDRRQVATEADHGALPVTLEPGDHSISVHCCHGRIRQVEVLRDELWAALQEDRTLQPRDIVIMTPDLESFAPLCQAVFSESGGVGPEGGGASPREGNAAAGLLPLPLRVADRSLRQLSAPAEALFQILELASSRVTASSVLDLLGLEPVRRRAGLSLEELGAAREWIQRAGIRWGLDAEHRTGHGQPAYRDNTWRLGLDRLLLARALSEEEGDLFAGVLPCGEAEGEQAESLGRLVRYLELLLAELRGLEQPRTMSAWQQALSGVLDSLIQPAEDELLLVQQLRQGLAELSARAAVCAAADQLLTREALQALLEGRFAEASSGPSFGADTITLCAMVPLRSIPFRVVCLLGLDDDAFPRKEGAQGLDLLAARPRPGDRSIRDDDHHLFLEAVLSARDRLIITYTGRSGRDNKELPPAVPVSELLEVIGDSFKLPGHEKPDAAAVLARVAREHPLQAFSPRNFGAGGAAPSSFDRLYLEGARALLGEKRAPPGFLDHGLPASVAPPGATPDGAALAGSAPRSLELQQLTRFLAGPGRSFLQQRLGIFLGEEGQDVLDREPLELQPLERSALGRDLLDWSLEDRARESSLLRLRASGRLPPGALGERVLAALEREVADLTSRAREARSEPQRPPVHLDTFVGDTQLSGFLPPRWGGGLSEVRYSRLGASSLLGLWVRHLALALADPEGAGASTLIARGEKGTVAVGTLAPLSPADARAELETLVELYWRGMESPLLFFPETSSAYLEAAAREPDDPSRWLEHAREVWRPRQTERSAPGEGEDPYHRQLYGEAEPFDPGFCLPGLALPERLRFDRLAQTIWGPLTRALVLEERE